MNLADLYWHQPWWLVLALQPFLLLWICKLHEKKRLNTFAAPALHPWVVVDSVPSHSTFLLSRKWLYIFSWSLFAIAAAGPRSPENIQSGVAASGSDIMAVVDISRSMHATDIRPTRLRQTHLKLQQLNALRHSDRLGITVFAARPHLFMPLSQDADTASHFLASFDSLVPPTEGSQLVAALLYARQMLINQQTTTERQQVILLFTDGDTASLGKQTRSHLEQIARELKQANMPLYIIGVGSVEGEAVPDYTNGWLTVKGSAVISRMDELSLQSLAEAGGGRYHSISNDDSDLTAIYTNAIANLTSNTATDEKTLWHEYYLYALLPGILLLFFALLPYRLATGSMPAQRVVEKTLMLGAFTLFILLATENSHAGENFYTTENNAYTALAAGQFGSALDYYATLRGYRGRLGEGVSAYRLGDNERAIQAFNQAVLLADNDHDRATALYNLANSYFQLGDYKTAINNYRDALLYRPAHQQSKRNLAFSNSLQKIIDSRLQRASDRATRMGRGPRSAIAVDNIDINELGSLSLDDSDTPSDQTITDELPALSDEQALLVIRGLEFARLAAANGIGSGLQTTAKPGQDEYISASRIDALQDKQALLWQRLFEVEEGFPAPLEQPEPLQGVVPW